MSDAPYIQLPIIDLGPVKFNLANTPWRDQGYRLVVSGASGSGKSSLIAVIAEEVYGLGVPFVVIDPEGEYRSLCDMPGVLRVGNKRSLRAFDLPLDGVAGKWIYQAIEALHDGAGVVLDLFRVDEAEQRLAYTYFLRAWLDSQEEDPQAAFLFIDEAHIFAPQKIKKGAAEARDITATIARCGRKFGINWVISSQRPRDVDKDVIAQGNCRFFGKVEIDRDFEALKTYLPRSITFGNLRNLKAGEFYLSAAGNFNLVTIRRRRTRDLASTPPVIVRSRQSNFFDLMQAERSKKEHE